MRAGTRLLIQRRVVTQAPITDIDAVVQAQEVVVGCFIVGVITVIIMVAAEVIVNETGVNPAIVNLRRDSTLWTRLQEYLRHFQIHTLYGCVVAQLGTRNLL
ncbi:hypothetical protein D3C76_1341390 [compost metagenome]